MRDTITRGYDMKHSALPMTIEAEVQQFEQLYQEHLDPIYRFVYSHVRNREVAEDLTSQIFLKAVRSLDLERSAHSSTAWLFRVAHTTMADYWRAYYRRAATHSLEALVEAGWESPIDADPPLVKSSVADRVEDILQSLPERDREVLTCRFLLNLSVRQTAVSMGVTETNVKVMQYRALRRAANSPIRSLSGPERPRVGLAATPAESAAQPKRSNASPHPRCPRPAPG
jgi:RNA polymerase sigma-70 factor, ECF subfamily